MESGRCFDDVRKRERYIERLINDLWDRTDLIALLLAFTLSKVEPFYVAIVSHFSVLPL